MIVMTAIDSRNRFANTLKELAAKKTLEKITTEEIVKAAGDNNGWLGYNKLFESNLRKSSEL